MQDDDSRTLLKEEWLKTGLRLAILYCILLLCILYGIVRIIRIFAYSRIRTLIINNDNDQGRLCLNFCLPDTLLRSWGFVILTPCCSINSHVIMMTDAVFAGMICYYCHQDQDGDDRYCLLCCLIVDRSGICPGQVGLHGPRSWLTYDLMVVFLRATIRGLCRMIMIRQLNPTCSAPSVDMTQTSALVEPKATKPGKAATHPNKNIQLKPARVHDAPNGRPSRSKNDHHHPSTE